MTTTLSERGAAWFAALTAAPAGRGSVLAADVELGGRPARILATRPDPGNPWPRARGGELGLVEGWALASAIRAAVDADRDNPVKRTLVAVVDSPSQAYGYQEELLAIHQSLAASVDAYSAARLAGHPVVSLVVGWAISGAFLAHGLQSHRILMLDDDAIQVQAMSKESAARITLRTVAELDAIAKLVPATAYDGHTFATLGVVDSVLSVQNADAPTAADLTQIRAALAEAAASALAEGATGIAAHRLASAAAAQQRAASIEVRRRLAAEWEPA